MTRKSWRIINMGKLNNILLEQPVNQRRNKKENKKILRETKMEKSHIKTCGMEQKQF
jgi:hypothetical protein